MNNKPRVSAEALLLNKSFEIEYKGKQLTVIKTFDAVTILHRKTTSGTDSIEEILKRLNKLLNANTTNSKSDL